MNTINIKIKVPEKSFWAYAMAIGLSVFMVAAMVHGATTIDTGSVGIATSTPGAALGVKGAAIIEGFIHADYFYSTSTSDSTFGGALNVTEAATSTFTGGITAGTGGLASTGGLRVDVGMAIFDETIEVDGNAATSTFAGGLLVDTDTLVVDFNNDRVGIGTTTPGSSLVVGSGSATTTLFLAGGASVGAEIILKSSDGSGCISIIADRNGNDVGAVAMSVTTLLTASVVACPAE